MQRVGNQTGKILERFLHEMIALYACLFWGANFEEELKRRKLIDKSSTRSLKTTTVGTAYEIIKAITKALKKEPQLQKVWKSLDRGSHLLLPNSVHVPSGTKPVATEAVLRNVEG